MRQVSDVEVFVRVVESASYAAAAKSLGVSRSHASRMVAALETRLGVRLLHRTTRRISVTQTGQTFFDACAPLLAALAAAETRAASERDEVVGTLRLSVPAHFGHLYLASEIARFQQRYPSLETVVDYSDRKVDLVAEGLDLAIRGGSVDNPSLIAKRLWPFQSALWASPSYLAAHPALRSPSDLATHRCLIYSGASNPRSWRLRRAEEELVVQVSGPMTSQSPQAILLATLEGLGVALLPEFAIDDELRSARLVRVLPEWLGAQGQFWAVRPHRTHLPARVRLFIEFLAGLWPTPPWAGQVG